ncbi:multicopper oxidase CueO [soil metagenome]
MNDLIYVSSVKVYTIIILTVGFSWLISGKEWDNSVTKSSENNGEPTVAGHPVLENLSSEPGIVEVELTTSRERITLISGFETNVYAYNGRIPGPMLEASEGDSVIVHFRNDLPEETTVHWHGIHLPFVMDGSPFHPVDSGDTFTIPSESIPVLPEPYHPHPHHRTAWQVGMGLYGGIIIRDPDDPLPDTLTEHLLILSDYRFDENGQIEFAEPGSRQERIDDMNGREGDVLFVNDEIMPELSIRSGEVQQWRIANASGARIYRLGLEGHKFIHIGSDGGFFEYPIETDEIVLANGERAELLVHGTGEPGSEVTLQTLPYDRYMPMWRPSDWNETLDLLTLQYTNESPADTNFELPETLRKIPKLKEEDATKTRIMHMTNGMINSKTMDMNRVDEVADLGTTEIWDIRNLVGMDHPFHLHGFQFQVIDRNGESVPQRKWKDTVNVPGFESARFIVRYNNYPGKWMFHCHILDHEDLGIMGVLEVK